MKDELQDFRDGEVLGALTAIRSLILSLPDPRSVSANVALGMERSIAELLGSTSAPDAMLRGIESARRGALPSPADLARLDEA